MTLKDLKQETDEESLKKHTDEIELNEKHLSLIYDILSDVIFFLAVEPDDCFRFVSVNQAFLAVTGLTRKQVVGRRIEQLLPETAHTLVISKYKEAINENKTVFWEEIFTFPTGELTGATTVTPVRTAEGVCTHLVGTVHDLTEIRRAEEALQKSKHKFRILADDLPSMIFVNQGGKVVYANQTCYDLMGYTVEEFLSPDFDFLSLIAPESLELIKEKLSEHMQGKEVVPYEYALLTKDGKRLNVIMTTRPIDYKGRSAILGSMTDITEHKRAEEALRESEGKLNAMLQSLGDHMSMMDKDLNILWANDVAKGLFGDDIIGKKCYEVYHNRNKPCEPSPCITLKAFKDDQVHEHETWVQTCAGNTLAYACNASVALYDDEGRPAAVIEISRDITEHKQLEEELKKLNEELEQRVIERTAELEEKNAELETMNRLFIGRELRMAELKKQIAELEAEIESMKNP